MIHERSRGWCAGVRLAARTLLRSEEPELVAGRLNGSTGAISAYLQAEVLDKQSAEDRDFLMRTSIVDVLEPGLLEELGGRLAQRRMAQLAGSVLVEELDGHSGRYRFHPWFRDLLRDEFSCMAPRRFAAHTIRAEQWLAAATSAAAPARRPTTLVLTAVPDQRLPGVTDQILDVERLTAKELEVLGHLASFMGTDEIASTMFVSVNTVRTHVRNILRKLGVNRRNDAVRRARALGLLALPASA